MSYPKYVERDLEFKIDLIVWKLMLVTVHNISNKSLK